MTKPAILALAALAAATMACDLNMTRGEGDMTSETRVVGDFSRIETGAAIDVDVRIGPGSTLEVRGQSNIVPIIVTDVANGTLRIRSDHGYTSTERVEVVLTAAHLDGIVLSGGSHGRIEGLDTAAFRIEASGGSRVTASGSAGTLALEMSGGSAAELADLSTETITLDLSGGCRAELRASDHVNGSATGGSRASILGNAQISVTTTGDSQVGPT